MGLKREEALSDMIDGLESDSLRTRAAEADPELAAMLDTVVQVKAARGYEAPSADFAKRGWEEISRAVQESRTPARALPRKRVGWIAAAASLLLALGLSMSPLLGQKDVSASQIGVVALEQAVDLGVKSALFPRYAGSDQAISYGLEDSVYVWNRASGRTEKLALPFPYARDASWSPDGDSIAFAGYDAASSAIPSPGIWIAGSEGADLKPAVLPSDADTAYEAPAWSPQGDRIAFTATRARLSDETGVVYERAVVVANADGSGLRTVAKGSQPTWSPDGKKLAYTVNEGTGNPQVWIADLADGTRRELAEGEMPAWSPAGAFIVCSKARTESRVLEKDEQGAAAFTAQIRYEELWAIHVESGTETQLTHSDYPEGQLAGMLADSKARGEWHAAYVVSGTTSDGQAAWSKDGKHLVFARESNEESGDHFALQELTVEYR